jgi:hypothetical protein
VSKRKNRVDCRQVFMLLDLENFEGFLLVRSDLVILGIQSTRGKHHKIHQLLCPNHN